MENLSEKKIRNRGRVVLGLVLSRWRRLVLAMGCMVVVAAATSASAYLVKPMLDDIFINKDQSKLLLLPGVAILVFFLKGMGAYGQGYFMNHVGQEIIKHFRVALYARIIDLPLAFYHTEKTGVLMSRITNDVNIVKGMVSTAVTSVLKDAFTVIGLIGVVLYMDWKLAIGAFVVLPVAFYPIVVFGRRVRRFSTGCQEAMADLNVFLHETFSGTKVVKIFTMEDFEKERFNKKAHTLFRLEMKSVIAKSLSSPVMEFVGGIGIAFIIWFGGSRVISGASTPGTFFSFLTAVMMLYDPVKKLSKLNNTVQEGSAALTRIFDIIERESEITEPEESVELNSSSVGVGFENLTFAYDPAEKPVLRDICLNVEPGEVMALVGMSGGGKTSLVNLVPRFYDATEGRVLVNGHDVKNFSLNSLRRNISIVTQEPILFNETVRDNIRYGRMDATDEEVENAARSAYAHDFIMGFPKGYDTRIGELGNRLSGGEKQRICIARALIKDAPVLILDEATSALDAEAERVVQKALSNLMQGRTTLVIAHRLSTIDHAHRIVLLKKGAVVEQGTHEQLMAEHGEYYKLQTMQNSRGVIDRAGEGQTKEEVPAA
ncbi:MAG: lipid A export permease/ATP-binding protein MsbA [Desulfobacteraceae bacterium]|nr:lipid A export permease/ATP-binding protein MsbA [Desulfobacteraceae bacterium]